MASQQVPAADARHHQQYTDGDGQNSNGYAPARYDMEANHTAPKPFQSTVSQVYDPTFFKIANPGPLGLISFALTTFVLGFYQCGVG